MTGQFLTGAGSSGLVGILVLAGVQVYKAYKRSRRAAPGESSMVTADRNAAIVGLNNTIEGLTKENQRLRDRVQHLEDRVSEQETEIRRLRNEIRGGSGYSIDSYGNERA